MIMANPIVTITMANGDVMKAELYPEIAPNTVNNFISLVKEKVSRFSNQSGTSGKNLADPWWRFGNRWRRYPSHNRRSGVENLRLSCSETAAGSGKNQEIIRKRTNIKNGGKSRHFLCWCIELCRWGDPPQAENHWASLNCSTTLHFAALSYIMQGISHPSRRNTGIVSRTGRMVNR